MASLSSSSLLKKTSINTRPSADDKGALLIAGMSALMGIQLSPYNDGATKVSLLDNHNKTYSYGQVGGQQRTNNQMEIFVKTDEGNNYAFEVNSDATVTDLKNRIERDRRIPRNEQRLVFAGRQIEDRQKMSHYGVTNGSVIHLVLRTRGGSSSVVAVDGSSCLDPASMDPPFDYDFRNIKDTNESFERGGVIYVRPCGYLRFAINVKNKFENEIWLGHRNGPGEWPVSYHGTGFNGTGFNESRTIAKDGYDLTGQGRYAFQHGIYTTPDIHVAEKYGIEFTYQGKKFIVLLQNRVNPDTLIKLSNDKTGIGEYWISPNEQDVRPYGICIGQI